MNIFRIEVLNLKKHLKKVLQDIKSSDKTIIYFKTQLFEIINNIYLFKNKIQKFHYQINSSIFILST